MEIQWSKTLDELKASNFKNSDKIYFTCSKCNKQQTLTYKCVISRDIFICRACRGIETQIKLHKENPSYGWFANEKDATWFKSENFKEKRKNTMIKKYGAEYTTQSEILLDKKHQTSLERYGNASYTNREKCIETNIKRHGVMYAGFQDEKSKLKSVNTCLEKYGVKYTAQVESIRQKQCRKYYYNGTCFDSLPELYYYFWLKDNNIDFSYNKKYHKQYLDSNGKAHYYFYDFKIGDKYVEIKGEQFFTNNKPISYSGYDWTDKYKFIKSEGIELIKSKRFDTDLKYMKENFYNNRKEVWQNENFRNNKTSK